MRARIIILVVVVFLLAFGAGKLWRRGEGKPAHADSQATAVAKPTADSQLETASSGLHAGKAAEPAVGRADLQEFTVERGTSRFDLKGAKRLEVENPYGHVVLAPGQGGVEVVLEYLQKK